MNANPVERLKNRRTDEQRTQALAALAANGGKDTRGAIYRTAQELRIPAATLRAWANGKHPPVAAQSADIKRGDLADALEAVAWQLIDLMPAAARKAPLNQLAIAASISIDKARLLREKATQHHGEALTPAEALERLNAWLVRAEAEIEAKRLLAGHESGSVRASDRSYSRLPPDDRSTANALQEPYNKGVRTTDF
jgi:hypothetical protein